MKIFLLFVGMFYSTFVAAHNVLVILHNESNTSLTLISGNLAYGAWTQGTPATINPRSNVQFGATSNDRIPIINTPVAGVEGSVKYKMGSGEFFVYFNNSLVSGANGNTYDIRVPNEFEYRVTGGAGADAQIHIYLSNSIPHYVGNFRPTTHGFPYANSWRGYGNYTVANTPFGRIPGGAENGLCGGMSYAVRDYYEAGLPICNLKPANVNDSYFTYIKDRLLQSLNAGDISLYLKYSDPTYPDTDKNMLNWVPVLGYQGRAFTVIIKEWPAIQADILAGRLSCLGLIYTKELNLGVNHQVVCYGYEQKGNTIELKIYDPNQPLRDDIFIRFNNTNLAAQLQLENNLTNPRKLNCLFRTGYERRTPPPYHYFTSQFRYVSNVANENGFLGAFPNCHVGYYGGKIRGAILLKHTAGEWRDIKASEIGDPKTSEDRCRAINDYAVRNGFLSAFPNFHEADHGQGKVYGTILIKREAGEWKDIKASELGDPVTPEDKFRAVNTYAHQNGFLGAYPNFHEADHGQGKVYGTILIKREAGEWRGIPPIELGNSSNFEGMFRALADYSPKNGFLGAFPNFHEAVNPFYKVYGTIMLKKEAGEWRDVKASDIRNPITPEDRIRAVNTYANQNGFLGAYPNFQEADYGQGKVYGTIFIKKEAGEARDVKASDLGNPVTPEDKFRAVSNYANQNGFLGAFPNFHEADYGQGKVYGVILIKKEAGEWRDINANDFRIPR